MPDPDLSSVESVLWAVNGALTIAVGVLFWRLMAAGEKLTEALKAQNEDGKESLQNVTAATQAAIESRKAIEGLGACVVAVEKTVERLVTRLEP